MRLRTDTASSEAIGLWGVRDVGEGTGGDNVADFDSGGSHWSGGGGFGRWGGRRRETRWSGTRMRKKGNSRGKMGIGYISERKGKVGEYHMTTYQCLRGDRGGLINLVL